MKIVNLKVNLLKNIYKYEYYVRVCDVPTHCVNELSIIPLFSYGIVVFAGVFSHSIEILNGDRYLLLPSIERISRKQKPVVV